MRNFPVFLLVALVSIGAAPAEPLVRVRLETDSGYSSPGSFFRATVRFEIEPGWHIYAEDPGEAGMATSVDWKFPPGLTAGPLAWPEPKTFKTTDITTYGYEKELALVSEIRTASDVPLGSHALAAEVRWLACREECVPGKTRVETELFVQPNPVSPNPEVSR